MSWRVIMLHSFCTVLFHAPSRTGCRGPLARMIADDPNGQTTKPTPSPNRAGRWPNLLLLALVSSKGRDTAVVYTAQRHEGVCVRARVYEENNSIFSDVVVVVVDDDDDDDVGLVNLCHFTHPPEGFFPLLHTERSPYGGLVVKLQPPRVWCNFAHFCTRLKFTAQPVNSVFLKKFTHIIHLHSYGLLRMCVQKRASDNNFFSLDERARARERWFIMIDGQKPSRDLEVGQWALLAQTGSGWWSPRLYGFFIAWRIR